MFLDAVDPETPIVLYVNSGGGVVTSGLAIYDVMQVRWVDAQLCATPALLVFALRRRPRVVACSPSLFATRSRALRHPNPNPNPNPTPHASTSARRCTRCASATPRAWPRCSCARGRRAIDTCYRTPGTFYTLVPIRPRSRCERRSLRTFAGASLRPTSLGFNTRPRRLSTPSDAFQLHPDVRIVWNDPHGDGPPAAPRHKRADHGYIDQSDQG